MENMDGNQRTLFIQRLQNLEYEIRKSITVREDQEEDADSRHVDEVSRCGITVPEASTKGDLLNVVQTALRAAQAEASKK